MLETVETVREREREHDSNELSFINYVQKINKINHMKDGLYSNENLCYIVRPFCAFKGIF